MVNVVLAAGTVWAVFGKAVTDVPPAGKCKVITLALIEFNTLRYKYWHLLNVPDDEAFADLHSEYREIYSTSHNVVRAINKIKTKDNGELPYAFRVTYGNDLDIYEEAIDENALIIDTRYTIIAKGNKFSATDEKELLVEDKACDFVGSIRKLENKHL